MLPTKREEAYITDVSQDIRDLLRDLWVQKRFNGFLWDLIVEEAIW